MAPPVLLVHGFATTGARTWGDNGWIDIFQDAGRQVFAPDLLGHGSAPRPHDPAAYDAMHELLLDGLPDEPVDAVGFSLGSRLIILLAGLYPERFNRIVLTAVGENLVRETDQSAVADALVDEDPDAVESPQTAYFRRLSEAPGVDPEAWAALLRRSSNIPLTDEQLARVTAPALVAIGDGDFAGPGDPLVERLPNAQLKVLRGVDHFSTPKSFELIEATLAFLDPDTP